MRAGVTVVAEGKNWSTTVTGTSNDYFPAGNWTIAEGRVFEPAELQVGASVCLVGATVKRELFGANADVLGRSLRVKNFTCDIVGVLGSKGQAAMGLDQDDVVVMPVVTVQRRLTGSTRVNTLLVSMKPGSDSAHLKSAIGQLLRERRKLGPNDDDNFNVLDTQQLAETLSGTTALLTSLLGAVAAVSLLVGGIGIMNIMLVSVTERTREIGIRLAIGALEKQVLTQFLVESVVLALFGGLIGIVTGLGLAAAASIAMEMPFAADPRVVAYAFLVSAAIGVVFGYFPARRAARLDPIEALRRE